jgi:predicted nucleotidyltransferase
MEKDIVKATGISRAGANLALKQLVKDNLVKAEKRGRMSFYSIDLDNPLIRQLKVLLTLTLLEPTLKIIKEKSQKVIFFGSSAQGTNLEDSDIDLFVLSSTPSEIAKTVSKSPLAERIQIVAKKPVDLASIKKNDPVFYEQVERGIVLWEAK